MHRAEVFVMYEYANDILHAMKIDPKDVILIRHTDSPKDKEHRFIKAQEAGFIKEYTAMQTAGYAKGKDYLMVFIGEPPTLARFFAIYQIINRFPTRKDYVPEAYPNKREVEAEGEYLEFREIPLLQGVKSFVVDWGGGTQAWHQSAEIEKPITEITLTGGAQV